MDEQIAISTPEQVTFHYETAGIGSRFLAALLDHLILGLVLTLMSCAFISLASLGILAGSGGGDSGSAGAYLIAGIIILVYFLAFWGYFVIFEIVWRGRTPGKRASKLRVLRRDGQPIGAGEAIIRNLVRLVDFLPAFYAIGLTSMFIDKEARRLGDFAAGTIVVRETDQVALRDVRVPEQPSIYASGNNAPASAYNASYPPGSTGAAPQPSYAVARYDPLPGVGLYGIRPEDYMLIREMLERVGRREIEWQRGQELATRLAYGVAARMGHDFGEWQRRGWDPVVFLQSVLSAQYARSG